ncbi:MAG: S41 family peptidase [Candidatus Alcyoniella australis]|nr:S41 family peptidase [Candidatus Alcyoniella australis]
MIKRHAALLWIIALLALYACLACCQGADDDDDVMDDSSDDDDVVDDDDDQPDDDDLGDDDQPDDDDDDGPFYADFLRFWQTMDQGYAYFTHKSIDWDAAFERYAPLARVQNDRAQFSLLIAQITASLGDSHTWSTLAGVPADLLPDRTPTGVCLERMDGAVYVTRPSVQAAGLEPGDEVLLIDGETPDELLERAMDWEGCSSPQCCDFWRLSHVERFSAGADQVQYTVERAGLELQFSVPRNGESFGACTPQPLLDFLADAQGEVLRYKPLGADLGYLRLTTLNSGYEEQILSELDAALALFSGRDGIVFDARYNRGGSDLVAMSVLARFLDRIVTPAFFRYKSGPGHDDFTLWIPHPVLPGNDPNSLDVVFLINGACISAGDFFAAAASYVQSFSVLGTTSCGGTGAPRSDTLPDSGIVYRYSQMQRRYQRTGEQIEGIGVAPEYNVPSDPLDLAAGVDTQLEAAAALLRAR